MQGEKVAGRSFGEWWGSPTRRTFDSTADAAEAGYHARDEEVRELGAAYADARDCIVRTQAAYDADVAALNERISERNGQMQRLIGEIIQLRSTPKSVQGGDSLDNQVERLTEAANRAVEWLRTVKAGDWGVPTREAIALLTAALRDCPPDAPIEPSDHMQGGEECAVCGRTRDTHFNTGDSLACVADHVPGVANVWTPHSAAVSALPGKCTDAPTELPALDITPEEIARAATLQIGERNWTRKTLEEQFRHTMTIAYCRSRQLIAALSHAQEHNWYTETGRRRKW